MTAYNTPVSAPWPTDARGAALVLRWPGWLVCMTLAALWFGCTAWLRPLAIPDEGRYVGVAWEMLRSGHWRVPTLDGLPFFHKPPLFYWITAAALRVFGPSVVAARAAPWLASVAITTGLFVFVSRWRGRRQAWVTVAVLMTAPLFYGAAQYANMDLLVAACVSSAILLFAHAALARASGRGYAAALAGAFLAMALGVLAKGLIGIALPLLVLAVWGLATRRLGRVLTLLLWGPGWLIFAAVAVPWFVAVQARFPGFGHYFFVVQHFQRFASTGFNNPQPWWFYPIALIVLTVPWSPWLVAWARRRPPHADATGSDVRTLTLAWLGVTLAFFSMPSSKLIGYILPALPPLACLIADAVTQVRPGGSRRQLPRAAIATLALAAVTCVGAAVAAHFLQPKSNQVLAERLGRLKQAGEPVFFLGDLYYDVAFYARLDQPVTVVDPWRAEELAKDSWRRELMDASHMAPAGSARRLLQPAEFAPALCRAGSSWVLGPWPAAAANGWLAGQAPVQRSATTALWHVDAAAPGLRAALQCGATHG